MDILTKVYLQFGNDQTDVAEYAEDFHFAFLNFGFDEREDPSGLKPPRDGIRDQRYAQDPVEANAQAGIGPSFGMKAERSGGANQNLLDSGLSRAVIAEGLSHLVPR